MKTKAKEMKDVEHKMLAKRSELLFFYDARMCNPNGDPNENKPRFDEETHKLYVTEFRLKRTIRKYLNQVMGHKILLRQELDEKLEKAEGEESYMMLDRLAADYIYELKSKKKDKDGKEQMIPKIKQDELLADHIDCRLFGILFAIGKINFKKTGPVQFVMGQSLNTLKSDTDIIPISMTALVPNTKNEAGLSKGGSFGEKWIVRYAFMQFHGFINNNLAEEVKLTEADVKAMLTAMWLGTDDLTTTSKFGQKSRLLIKVNYKDNGYLGDLDLQPKLEYGKTVVLENITEIQLKLDGLLEMIENNKRIIESIEYMSNPMLQCTHNGRQGTFEKIITDWKSPVPVERLEIGDEEIVEASHV